MKSCHPTRTITSIPPETPSRQSHLRVSRKCLGAALGLLSICPAFAANLYWDPGTSATGAWGSGNSNWNSAANGSGTFTDTTTTSDTLTFSATPVTTAGTVTVSGTQSASSITINQTGLTFTGGTIATTSTLIMNSATSASVESALTLGNSINFNGSAAQTLTLSGGQSGLVTVVGGNTAKALTGTLILNGSGTTNYQFSAYNIGNASAGTGGAVLNTGAIISYGTANTLSIGNSAVGLLTINGGTIGNDTTTNISVGRTSGTGRLILNSGSITLGSTRVLNIGQSDSAGGSGRVEVNGGALTIAGTMNIGISQTGSAGTAALNITGGTSSIGTVNFGNSSTAGTSSLTLTGGSLYIGSGGLVSLGSGTFSSSISLSGGTVGASANWSSAMNMTLGTANGNVTFRAADSGGTGRNISLSGALSGTGGLIKTGGGTLTLSGVNTFTGNTVVNAGSLVLSSGGETRFLVQNGGASNSLQGTGILTANGIFRLDISGFTDATGTWTLVDVGTLTESFGSTFSLSFLGGSAFTNNNDGTYTNGNWTFSTITGNLSVVPEPSTTVTVLFGLGAFVLFCRRRSRVIR